jgi:hypothetical protein
MTFGHFSFGLSQLHGHGSWLMCEVALTYATWYAVRSRVTCHQIMLFIIYNSMRLVLVTVKFL